MSAHYHSVMLVVCLSWIFLFSGADLLLWVMVLLLAVLLWVLMQ
ncbi:MAG: hypothetical protein AB4352_10490 [Hormoscilla sp.]